MAIIELRKATADAVAAAIHRAGSTNHRVALDSGIPETTLRRKLGAKDAPPTAAFTLDDLWLIARALSIPMSVLVPDEAKEERIAA